MLVLNFKAYKEATGEGAVKLAQIAADVAESTGLKIVVAPQTADIIRVSPIISTFAQHTTAYKPGSRTGSTIAETIKSAGAIGSILNHSEKRIPEVEIEGGIKILKELGMASIVCVQDPKEAEAFSKYSPDYIAIEPPELIGSGISVSSAKPEVITSSVAKIKDANPEVKVLCGAGISNGSDIKKAMELGVDGILLASAFVKAENPKQVLEDMAGGFK